MPYTTLSLSLTWIVTVLIVGVAASGRASGIALAALVLVALAMPSMVLRLVARPVAVKATPTLRTR